MIQVQVFQESLICSVCMFTLVFKRLKMYCETLLYSKQKLKHVYTACGLLFTVLFKNHCALPPPPNLTPVKSSTCASSDVHQQVCSKAGYGHNLRAKVGGMP